MDNWGTEENKNTSSDITMKILIAIIIFLAIIIGIIITLIYILKMNTFKLLVDGETKNLSSTLIKTVDDITYINIQEMAALLGYEYHIGEYKIFSSDEDKCYIQSANETASFYLNSNKICKLKVGELTEDYDVLTCENNIIEKDDNFYAPIDAIEKGFNVSINEEKNKMSIMTLNKTLTNLNNKLNKSSTDSDTETTYESFLEGDFNNQKAVLYNYIVFCKKSSGLYGIMTTSGQEILPDKYKSIEFSETTQEFLVTNSLDKIGIVDSTGRNKIEQLYDSIKVIGNDPKLYLVETNEKYGVIDENGNTIVYPEYDSIGIDTTIYTNIQNQYVLLNSVIPVCKDNKYGLFDLNGTKVLDVSYDGIGCALTSVELNGITKAINPLAAIEECEGIVIKNGEVYDLFLIGDKELISLKVSSIYYTSDNGELEYYMIYKENELNLIERLVKNGIIKNSNETEDISSDITNNTTEENTIENLATNETVE